MDISVVIPSFNNQETIAEVLEALVHQRLKEGQIEIVAIDDHSTDGTNKIIEGYPVVRIANGENLGLAGSLNKAILQTKYDVIVTLHADTVPASSIWLEQLIAPLIDPNVAAACSMQIPPNPHDRDLTVWEKLLYLRQGPHNALNDKADAYRKTILTEIGLFDDKTFRTAGEDEDLALRLRMHQVTIKGTQALVIHDHYFKDETNILGQILNKEFIFGKACGALRRKYPYYKPGSYIFPTPKPFTNDGLFRVALCIGVLIPYIQLICIPLLFIAASIGITKFGKGNRRLVIVYPFFNILRFATFTVGYFAGIVKGKQT